MREIEIWQFEISCLKCDSEISVVYPRNAGGLPGQWGIVGELLTDKDYCNVEQKNPKTQGWDVHGNVCTDCGAHEGNIDIHEIVYSAVAAYQSWEKARELCDVVDVIEVPTEESD
jgi:hypothetical protein